jgi:hypothetical protein
MVAYDIPSSAARAEMFQGRERKMNMLSLSGFITRKPTGSYVREDLLSDLENDRPYALATTVGEIQQFVFTGIVNTETGEGTMFDDLGPATIRDFKMSSEKISFTKNHDRPGGVVTGYVFQKTANGYFDGTYTSSNGLSGPGRCMLAFFPAGFFTDNVMPQE